MQASECIYYGKNIELTPAQRCVFASWGCGVTRNDYFIHKCVRQKSKLQDYLYQVFKDIPYYLRVVLGELSDDARLFSHPDEGLSFQSPETFKRLALFSSSLKTRLLPFHWPRGSVQYRTIAEQGERNATLTGSRGPFWTRYLFICGITPPPRMSQVTRHIKPTLPFTICAHMY